MVRRWLLRLLPSRQPVLLRLCRQRLEKTIGSGLLVVLLGKRLYAFGSTFVLFVFMPAYAIYIAASSKIDVVYT